ncbi:MAG: site-2 protease family protein [Alphaproteobacteria bacterium]
MFGRGITLFRLLGFEVRLDFTWVLLAVLVAWTLVVGLFPANYPDLSPQSYLWMGVAGTLGIFASLVIHEFAHSLVARRYGLPITGITLFLFGGVAEMSEEPSDPMQELRMAIAGPLASIVLATALFVLHLGATAAALPVQISGVLLYLTWINGILAVFNMIPAFPLDGGRVLRAILWRWKGNQRWATRVASRFGSAFGVLLIVLGVLSVLTGNLVSGMWWFLIGLFIRGAATASYSETLTRQALQGVPVRRVMKADPVTVTPDMSLDDLVNGYFYRYYYKLFPVTESGCLLGCVTSRQLKDLPREQWEHRVVRDIMAPCRGDNTVGPDDDAVEVLAIMHRSGNSRLLVARAGVLEGIVTLKDMLTFLSMKLELENGDAIEASRLGTTVFAGNRFPHARQ